MTINDFAQSAYKAITKNATKDLMRFLSQSLCVTYFDEAHWMDSTLWVLLRVLQYQDRRLGMWYIFMGTKSSVTYYAPGPSDSEFPLLFVSTPTYLSYSGFIELDTGNGSSAAAICGSWFRPPRHC